MRSKPLFLWYVVILLLFFEIAAYWLSGQAIGFVQRGRWQAFSNQVKVWQPVGDEPYAVYINRFSTQYGINAKLVAAVIQAESSFQAQAVSKSGAYGLMQIIPGTWKQVNDELNICKGRHAGECTSTCYRDPELNIHIGTAYLSQLVKHYNGNVVLAVAAYNAGPGAVDRYGRMPEFQETQEYVERVIDYWQNRLPSNERRGVVISGHWFIVHRYVGWALIITMLFFLVVVYVLYRHYGSWRWR